MLCLHTTTSFLRCFSDALGDMLQRIVWSFPELLHISRGVLSAVLSHRHISPDFFKHVLTYAVS